jgi:hypothetical protein
MEPIINSSHTIWCRNTMLIGFFNISILHHNVNYCSMNPNKFDFKMLQHTYTQVMAQKVRNTVPAPELLFQTDHSSSLAMLHPVMPTVQQMRYQSTLVCRLHTTPELQTNCMSTNNKYLHKQDLKLQYRIFLEKLTRYSPDQEILCCYRS